MKIIKIVLLLVLLSISSAFAQTNAGGVSVEYGVEATSDDIIVHDNITVKEESLRDKTLGTMLTFVSSAILAFLFCILFPKFSKKTGEILLEKNKFIILFEALKVLFILISITLVGILIKVGLGVSIMSMVLFIALYNLGLSVFSIGILEWIFKVKKISFAKLNMTNKAISILSINLFIMVLVLPFDIIPGYETIIRGQPVNIDIASIFVKFVLYMIGFGMVSIHLKEIILKNKKKF